MEPDWDLGGWGVRFRARKLDICRTVM